MKKNLLFLSMLFTLITISSLHAEYLENATPPAKEFDWMELQSGEWLKGEFKGLYSGEIEFDSEEFDLVTFDVGDVKQLITKGNSVVSLNRNMPSLVNAYKHIQSTLKDEEDMLDGKNEILANLRFENNTFSLRLPDGSQRDISESDIASIAGGEPKESNYWSASIFLGVDVLSGNSDQVTITGKASAERRTVLTRFLANYLTTYTQVDGNKTTANNNRFSSSFDMYQTAHFYWRLASVEYLRDPFRNIGGQYTVAVGIGYDIVYTPKTNWSVTMGPGYQHTTYNDYNATDPSSIEYADTGLFFLSSRFDTEVTSDIDFIINYNGYLVNKESGRYTHHTEVALETEIINNFTVDLSVFWDRTSIPIAFADGTSPEQDDFKSMLAIGYSY